MDRQTLEEIVKDYPLEFMNLRDPQAENGRFPSFIATFWRSMEKRQTVPTQAEFVADYGELNGLAVTKGLEARLRRTYPSLVRELHARLLAEEVFSDTHYSLEDDLAGVDLTIRYQGQTHYVHLYVDTQRGNHFRLAKENRHDFEGSHINVSLNLKHGRKVGAFLFYPDSTFRSLKDALDAREDA